MMLLSSSVAKKGSVSGSCLAIVPEQCGRGGGGWIKNGLCLDIVMNVTSQPHCVVTSS